MRGSFVAWIVGLLIAIPSSSRAEDSAVWPQWRGPTRDGIIAGQEPWPESLSGDMLQQIWRIPLAPSYSGPIVGQNLVYTTETKSGREFVRAVDRETGQQKWEVSWEGSMSVPFFAKSNGDWIRATPLLDDGRLYVAGMRDVLVCLDAMDGHIIWQVDFVKNFQSPLPSFGMVSSPVVDGEYLFVQAGGGVCRLEKRTGKIVWRVMEDGGGMNGSAFSSPFMAEIAGKRQLLVQTREKLAGLDTVTGKALWSEVIPSFRGMNILTPTLYNDTVFTSSYGGKSHLFRLASSGDAVSCSTVWVNKASGYMSTPVVIDGRAYLHLQNQRFTCIDLTTGTTLWTSTPFGKYWSLVANGTRILALDQRGELNLIRANPEKFEKLDSRKISDDETWAHLAVCGEEIFIRELNALAVYRWQSKK